MPAKKKSQATKKAASTSKKTSVSKKKTQASTEAQKSSASKKSTTKKTTVKKAAAKKTATKKATAKKSGGSKTTAKKAKSPGTSSKSSGEKKNEGKQVKTSEVLKRGKNSPKAFKQANRRSNLATFTMDDVKELLKTRKNDAEADAAASSIAASSEAKKQEKGAANSHIEESSSQKSRHNAASLDDILGLGTAGGKGSQSGIAPEHEKYYNMLMELRREVHRELAQHSSDTLKRSQKEDAGDIVTSSDAGTDNFDRDFALSLLSSEQEALNEIDAAIQRIHNGTYGICEITGERIAEERLEAVPFTRFSLEGQRQFESTNRKRVQRTGAFISEGSDETVNFTDEDSDN